MSLSITSRGIRKIAGKVNAKAQRRVVGEYLARAGMPHAKDIRTFTTPEELHALMNLAVFLPPNATVLEIGSYLGASTCHLAAGLMTNGGTIYCVDTWNNETMPDGTLDTMAEFSRNTQPVASMIRTVRKRSSDLTAADIKLPVDLAFIDGDHSYAAANADTLMVLPWIAPHGIIAFHDTGTFEGVSRTLGELLATGKWCLSGHVNNLSWIRRPNWQNSEFKS